MRYMMLVRSVAPPGPPPPAFLEAMGKMAAESAKNGKLDIGWRSRQGVRSPY